MGVAGVFLVVALMGAAISGLATIIVTLVRARARTLAQDRLLRRAAAGTPALQEAGVIYAERLRDRQRAMHGVALWFYEKLPGGMSGNFERKALGETLAPKVDYPPA